MTESKKIFTAGDFEQLHTVSVLHWPSEVAAGIANKIIESKLGPKVYGMPGFVYSEKKQHSADTHTAYLFDIQELPKKECKHEPSVLSCMDAYAYLSICRHCGVKLTAKWEVKK